MRTPSSFQSTHPLRDATSLLLDMLQVLRYFNPRTPYGMRRNFDEWFNNLKFISIHAPLTGCDIKRLLKRLNLLLFQSTHPLRDATLRGTVMINTKFISIHAPLTGCDDAWQAFLSWWHAYFNPRTPYGMRPMTHSYNPFTSLFQSTHPLRDATLERKQLMKYMKFQSTHPLRDATES